MSIFKFVKYALFAISLSLCINKAQATPMISFAHDIASNIVNVINGDVNKEVRGFRAAPRKGYGMNFGGGNNKAQPQKDNKNFSSNNNANKNNATANKTPTRSGLMGLLGGLGFMGLAMLGLGLFGGGFLIYLLIAMAIPFIIGMMNKNKMQAQEAQSNINTKDMSSNDVLESLKDKFNNKKQF